MTISRELRWALVLTVGLTALALLFVPGPEPTLLALDTRQRGESKLERSRTSAPPASFAPLPAMVEQTGFRAAETDLFSDSAPPAPAAPRAQTPPPPTMQPAPPPPPPPPLVARFVGRMLTPGGEPLIYLREGEQTVQARVGLVLPSGYVIEALLPAEPAAVGAMPNQRNAVAAVQLIYPALGHRETLRLPVDNQP